MNTYFGDPYIFSVDFVRSENDWLIDTLPRPDTGLNKKRNIS